MDETFFKYLVENQNKWYREYNANKEKQIKISVIQRRRYKSRGNQTPEEIQKNLEEYLTKLQ
jgi:hypothetical protein